MKPWKNVPEFVKQMCWSFDAFIIGGAAKYAAGLDEKIPRDWDVVVPFDKWTEASRIIPYGTLTNSFGGWKVIGADNVMMDVEIDVWPGDAAMIAATFPKRPYYMYHPKTRSFFEVK